jgi:CelD/BcsL family acetyltransferase involved in cellulose biosynthesis
MTLAGAVAGACHADRSWDVLELQCLDPLDAAALAAAGTGLRPAVRGEPSPFADLAAARAAGVPVLETLRSGTRARVRRSLRGFGALDTELAADPDQALDIFDELVDLHQASWLRRGEPGAFASERFHGFHRRLVPRLLERGELVLFRVRRAAGTVGCVYGFVDRNRMLMYQTGLATVREPRLKPGFVAHALCMEACLERGLDAYDLLPEDDQYKRQLSTSAAELMWLRAERSRVRLWPWNALRRTRRWARRRWAR